MFKRVSGFEEQHKEYSRRYTLMAQENQRIRGDSRLTAEERSKFVPWPELQRLWAQARANRDNWEPRELAILALYLGLPPRRIRDYALMEIAASHQDEADLDKEKNWLVLDGDDNPKKIMLNQYKTAHKYGQYALEQIPPLVVEALNRYLEREGLGP